jgi:hypothetical protein
MAASDVLDLLGYFDQPNVVLPVGGQEMCNSWLLIAARPGSSPCITIQYNLHYTENNSLATLTKALILINEPRTRPQTPLICLIFAGILLKKSALHNMNGIKLFIRYCHLFSKLHRQSNLVYLYSLSFAELIFLPVFSELYKQSNLFYIYSPSFAKNLTFYLCLWASLATLPFYLYSLSFAKTSPFYLYFLGFTSNLFYLYSLSFAKNLPFHLHFLSFTNNLTFFTFTLWASPRAYFFTCILWASQTI